MAKEEYQRNKDKYIERCYEWRKTDKGKASIATTYAEQKKKHPEKYKARTTLNNALAKGKISKPDACERCGVPAEKLAAHHHDYSRPLEVAWVCYSCHVELHNISEFVESTIKTHFDL